MSNASTLLCVGSGMAPRYVMNTLEGLALPSGADIQLRYLEKLFPSGLRDKLEARQLNGSDILLGYVNCTESGNRSGGRCPIVPYRQAELLDSERLGSVCLVFG
jgi:hypothetical protein